MWGKKNNFWSGNSDAARRRRARSRRANEERVKTQRVVEDTGPVRWEYHAPDDYQDVVYPPESECGYYVYPQGSTYYFDTQAERDEFRKQHLAKIRPIWEAKMDRLEAEEAQWRALWEAEEAKRIQLMRQREAQIQLEKEAYDFETSQMSCLPKKIRNLRDWWKGTHTWRGVRR